MSVRDRGHVDGDDRCFRPDCETSLTFGEPPSGAGDQPGELFQGG